MDAHYRSFEKLVLPVLVAEGIGVLGMKPLASGEILESGAATAAECLRYALQPADVGGHHRHRLSGGARAGAGDGADVPPAGPSRRWRTS